VPSQNSLLNRKQRFIVLKVMAMLSLVRWYNILLVSLGLELSAVFLLNPENEWLETLLDYKLHFLIASLCFYIMAGYIINAFYDFEKDLVNNPKGTIFNRVVSKRFCLNTYFLFNFIGTVLAIFIGWEILLLNSVLCFVLWFYSHKLRKKVFTGELGASLLTIAPFVSLSVYYGHTNLKIALYIGFIFALTLTRELVKKLVGMKGDLVFGDKSLPIVIGIKKTKALIYAFMLFSLIPVGILFSEIIDRPVFYYLIFSSIIILTSLFMLIPAKERKGFNRVNTMYKIILTLSVIAITLA
jgi:4-hydroxybenzoate polyprenyltransferase